MQTILKCIHVSNIYTGDLTRGYDKITCTIVFYDIMQNYSTAFLHRRRLLCAFNAS